MKKTDNYSLPQWEKQDFIKMEDFNDAFGKTDAALKALQASLAAAIGSGGNFALAAARALYAHTEMSAKEIAESALKVASEICVYTNSNIIVETV